MTVIPIVRHSARIEKLCQCTTKMLTSTRAIMNAIGFNVRPAKMIRHQWSRTETTSTRRLSVEPSINYGVGENVIRPYCDP